MVKMDSFILDTANMSEYFFENTELFGIGSDLNPMQLCQKFYLHFRLDLKRDFSNDWFLSNESKKSPVDSGELFSQEAEIVSQETYFPIFYDSIISSDTEFYLYTNKINGNTYIKQQKNVDYFLLIKNGQYIDFISDLQNLLLKIDRIYYCTKFRLSEINWKDNLIL